MSFLTCKDKNAIIKQLKISKIIASVTFVDLRTVKMGTSSFFVTGVTFASTNIAMEYQKLTILIGSVILAWYVLEFLELTNNCFIRKM